VSTYFFSKRFLQTSKNRFSGLTGLPFAGFEGSSRIFDGDFSAHCFKTFLKSYTLALFYPSEATVSKRLSFDLDNQLSI
jgi:hypothetical protein